MIMKLKSKDEVIVKLIEKMEEHEEVTTKVLTVKDSNMLQGYSEKLFITNGEVEMLKWVLGIPQDYTGGEIDDE